MTIDTMGKPHDMDAFRDRQSDRPSAVPMDVERRNAKSVQRSRGAHHDASKAGDAQVPDSVRDVIGSPGQQLDSGIQQTIEERMGDSLGDVRIHTGPAAAKACQDSNARAFTVGNHVAFNTGEYDPESAEGQHVLAHELAHVRQQTSGAVSMLPQTGTLEVDPDERLEREAERTAERVMRGGELGIASMAQTGVHVQRLPEGKVFEALALFEDELDGDDLSEHREAHNQHQLSYLHEVAQDVIEKGQKENQLDIKQQARESPDAINTELAQRYDSIADIKSQIEELQQNIDADLDDVALTDDQRLRLTGSGETDKWDNVSWTVVKSILSATAIPQLLELVEMGKDVSGSAATATADASTQAAGYDINERATQTIAHARRGEISSWDDIRDIWEKTDGTLEQRAEQIEREIREGVWESGLDDSTGDVDMDAEYEQ